MNLLEKFKIGLNKSSSSLSEGINNIFRKKKVDQEILREFEDLLISSDVGIETAQSLKNDFEKERNDLLEQLANYTDSDGSTNK